MTSPFNLEQTLIITPGTSGPQGIPGAPGVVSFPITAAPNDTPSVLQQQATSVGNGKQFIIRSQPAQTGSGSRGGDQAYIIGAADGAGFGQGQFIWFGEETSPGAGAPNPPSNWYGYGVFKHLPGGVINLALGLGSNNIGGGVAGAEISAFSQLSIATEGSSSDIIIQPASSFGGQSGYRFQQNSSDGTPSIEIGMSPGVAGDSFPSTGVFRLSSLVNVATLTQGQQANGSNPNPLTLSPQAPGGGASSTATGTPGSCVVQLAAPVSTGNEAAFSVKRTGAGANVLDAAAGGTFAYQLSLGGNPLAFYNNNSLTTDIVTSGQMFFDMGSLGAHTFLMTSSALTLFPPGGIGINGSGTGVLGIANASVNPSTNPSGGGVVYEDQNGLGLTHRGPNGAVTGLAATGSTGTVNSQAQTYIPLMGTCETVSSATPTTILGVATVSGKGGLLKLRAISRATTTSGGVTLGDSACSEYVLGYKNVGGTVTLSTAGITLITGTNQTTNATLTAPVLTTSVASNVITIKVTNAAACTVDSQVSGGTDVC